MYFSMAVCRSEEHTSELQSHSDLHSFPTRRSSDLYRRRRRHGCARAAQDSNGLRRLSDRVAQPSESEAPPCPPSLVDIPECRWPCSRAGRPAAYRCTSRWRSADRKSTRLNSSHTVIYTLSLHDALPIYTGVDVATVAREQPKIVMGFDGFRIELHSLLKVKLRLVRQALLIFQSADGHVAARVVRPHTDVLLDGGLQIGRAHV